MKLPENAIISPEKIKNYLLKWRPANDTSRFLELAGYTLKNWKKLEIDLRSQILSRDTMLEEKTDFGDLFKIHGELKGPNELTLRIVIVWMIENNTGKTKLNTLFPDRGKQNALSTIY